MRKSVIGLCVAMGTATPAVAQVAPSAPAPTPTAAKPAPSKNLVINLIHLLVEQGVLTPEKADALLQQAREEAAAAARVKPRQAKQPEPGNTTIAAAGAPQAPADTKPPLEPPAAGVVRVPYIPEIVRRQIENDVKQEVLKTAQAENWAAPNALPAWTRRISFNGDFRFRYEVDRFDKSNFSQFIDVNAFNSGNPIDIGNGSTTNLPFLNTTADRERLRLRARLGLVADVTDDFKAALRISTGNTTNPVSTNQTLGNSFTNYGVVIDRAYLQYSPDPSVSISVGRMPKPFFSTEMVWWDQLGFDGIAGTYQYKGSPSVAPFITAGVFPVENTAFSFPSTSSFKESSHDKWLYAAQIGIDLKFDGEDKLKLAAAYYDFHNIEGVPRPCTVATVADPCTTDNTRPQFVQFGNSMTTLRVPINSTGLIEPQYLGLASQFRELNVTGQFDFTTRGDYHLVLDGDAVVNLAYDQAAVRARGPAFPSSGNLGMLGGISYGTADVRERWDWRVGANYRYIESDAVVDAFNDPDFHLGGTNAKGFTLYGAIGVAHNVWLQTRLLSASQVGGAPFAVDVIQADLNARF